jgi:hypothetical protein
MEEQIGGKFGDDERDTSQFKLSHTGALADQRRHPSRLTNRASVANRDRDLLMRDHGKFL